MLSYVPLPFVKMIQLSHNERVDMQDIKIVNYIYNFTQLLVLVSVGNTIKCF